MDGEHIGTGFVIAPGAVMTNRHVVEALAFLLSRHSNSNKWVMRSEHTTINFSQDAEDASIAFNVKSVIHTGPNAILDTVRFDNLDMALLEVETTNNEGRKLPHPIPFLADVSEVKRAKRLFTVGYPAMPIVPNSDFGGVKRAQVVEQLRKIFGLNYGIKYFSPGIVRNTIGHHPQDTLQWVFDHNATTLGGNSGSCVCSLQEEIGVIGLHFAGDWMRANHAHSMTMVRERGGLNATEFSGVKWI